MMGKGEKMEFIRNIFLPLHSRYNHIIMDFIRQLPKLDIQYNEWHPDISKPEKLEAEVEYVRA